MLTKGSRKISRTAKKPQLIADMLGVAIEPTYFDLQHHQLNPAKIVKLIKNKHNEVNGLALAIDPDPDTKITFEKKESSRKNAGGNE